MAFDTKEACIAARQIITERSPSAVGMGLPRIRAMVPTAMYLWRQKVAKDKEARKLLESSFSLTLSSGVGDLTSYTNGTNANLNLKDLRQTTLYTTISGVRTPFRWVASQQQLNQSRQLAADSLAVFLEGTTLRTRNIDGSLTSLGSASVSFTAVSYPLTVAAIPAQLQEDFVLVLAGLAMKSVDEAVTA